MPFRGPCPEQSQDRALSNPAFGEPDVVFLPSIGDEIDHFGHRLRRLPIDRFGSQGYINQYLPG